MPLEEFADNFGVECPVSEYSEEPYEAEYNEYKLKLEAIKMELEKVRSQVSKIGNSK